MKIHCSVIPVLLYRKSQPLGSVVQNE